jgi:hypothetical protein
MMPMVYLFFFFTKQTYFFFKNEYNWMFNDEALEAAATSSRLPYDKMTNEEVNLFPDIVVDDTFRESSQIESYKIFLFIRNRIVN